MMLGWTEMGVPWKPQLRHITSIQLAAGEVRHFDVISSCKSQRLLLSRSRSRLLLRLLLRSASI